MSLKFGRAISKKIRATTYSKQPRGALLFPNFAYGPQFEAHANKISELKREMGLSQLYVFHGVAFSKGEQTLVLAGPPGIGKSTLMRKLE